LDVNEVITEQKITDATEGERKATGIIKKLESRQIVTGSKK